MKRTTKLIVKYVLYVLCIIFAIISIICGDNINAGCAVALLFVCLGVLVLNIDTNKD